MKIRTKLVLTFLAVILLPICLSSICAYGITQVQFKAMEKYYGMDSTDYEGLTDSTRLFNRMTKQIYHEIAYDIETDLTKLEDVQYLEQLNRRLNSAYSFLLLRCNAEILYSGGTKELTIKQ